MCENLDPKARTPIRFHLNQINVTFYAAMTYVQLFRKKSRWADLCQARRYQRSLENLNPPYLRPNFVPILAILGAESLPHQQNRFIVCRIPLLPRLTQPRKPALFTWKVCPMNERRSLLVLEATMSLLTSILIVQ
jgi:hypothetical protein